MKYSDLYESETSRRIIYSGPVFDVAQCEACLADGTPVKRDIILHNGAAAIIPIDSEGNIYLVRQYRYAADDITLEIPAGKLEKGEDPFACAERELREETGYSAESINCFGKLYTSPAILGETIYLYVAQGLKSGSQSLDSDERLNVEKLSLSDAVLRVMSGEITDAKTQIAILKLDSILKNQKK